MVAAPLAVRAADHETGRNHRRKIDALPRASDELAPPDLGIERDS
jgi:hypothetical protein